MIYRIDYEHFLTHMIDYFTFEEIINFQYAIISAGIKNNGRLQQCAKLSLLYPDPDVLDVYIQYNDLNLFEKSYFEYLDPNREDLENIKKGYSYFVHNAIFKAFVIPLKQHQDILIMCMKEENFIIDVFCKYLEKRFKIEVIDLNELFIKGSIGPIYIDREKIYKANKSIKQSCFNERVRELESTSDGRMKLIKDMSKKEKIEKLKEFGIDPVGEDLNNLDNLLFNIWNDEIENNE